MLLVYEDNSGIEESIVKITEFSERNIVSSNLNQTKRLEHQGKKNEKHIPYMMCICVFVHRYGFLIKILYCF